MVSTLDFPLNPPHFSPLTTLPLSLIFPLKGSPPATTPPSSRLCCCRRRQRHSSYPQSRHRLVCSRTRGDYSKSTAFGTSSSASHVSCWSNCCNAFASRLIFNARRKPLKTISCLGLEWFCGVQRSRVFAADYGRLAAIFDEFYKHFSSSAFLVFGYLPASAADFGCSVCSDSSASSDEAPLSNHAAPRIRLPAEPEVVGNAQPARLLGSW